MFKEWTSELVHMNEMAIERNDLCKNAKVVDLHIYAEASVDAMCIVVGSGDRKACLRSGKVSSSTNEVRVNISSNVWDSIETTDRRRTRD